MAGRPTGLSPTPNPANAGAPVAPFTHRRTSTPQTEIKPTALVKKSTGQVVRRALRPFTGTFDSNLYEEHPVSSIKTPIGANPQRLKVVSGALVAMAGSDGDALDAEEVPGLKASMDKCVDDLLAERQRMIKLVMLTSTTNRDQELDAAVAKADTAKTAIAAAADKAAVLAVDIHA